MLCDADTYKNVEPITIEPAALNWDGGVALGPASGAPGSVRGSIDDRPFVSPSTRN